MGTVLLVSILVGVARYFGIFSLDLVQTSAILLAVILSFLTFWYQTLRSPKFKIHPSQINPIELHWHQDEAFGDLDIIVSNEGAKVGTVSEIEVLEGDQISEKIECNPRDITTTIRKDAPFEVSLTLKATDRAQVGETYRIRIRVKGSDTCKTEEFEVKMPNRPPDPDYGADDFRPPREPPFLFGGGLRFRKN